MFKQQLEHNKQQLDEIKSMLPVTPPASSQVPVSDPQPPVVGISGTSCWDDKLRVDNMFHVVPLAMNDIYITIISLNI